MDAPGASAGPGGQFTFPSALHFLHREYNKFERERKWWLAEKAELQARIAFLEGQRLGEANLKRDLLRRIKMLETALRKERAKGGKAPADNDDADEAAAGLEPAASEGNVDKEGRHVLLQYLSEMQYTDAVIEAQAQRVRGMLDSWSPDMMPGTRLLREGPQEGGVEHEEGFGEEGEDDDDDEDEGGADGGGGGGGGDDDDDDDDVDDFLVGLPTSDGGVAPGGSDAAGRTLTMEAVDPSVEQTIPDEMPLQADAEDAATSAEDIALQQHIMKNFKGSKMSKRLGMGKVKSRVKATAAFDADAADLESKLGELSGVDESSVAAEAESAGARDAAGGGVGEGEGGGAPSRKTWKMKMELRGHLDGVREVLFHPHEPLLVSASEDATVAVWQAAPTPQGKLAQQSEPLRILRGHTAPVYAATFTAGGVLYTGGADKRVIAWNMPSAGASRYPLASAGHRLAVSDDLGEVVWSLDAHPAADAVLSGTAGGVCQLWDSSAPALREQWSVNVGAPVSSVQFVKCDSEKVLVGTQDGHLRLLDVETGKVVVEFKDDASDDGEGTGYLYDARSHPTMNVVAAAYGAKLVKVFDVGAGACVSTMVAHPSAVSSIDFDPSGLYMLSSGHNRSIRIWDFGTKKCVYEHTTHRHKHDESIHAARFHPGAAYYASAGADSIVRVFC